MTAAGILRFIVVVVRWKLPQERRFGLPGVGGHEMRWSEREREEVWRSVLGVRFFCFEILKYGGNSKSHELFSRIEAVCCAPAMGPLWISLFNRNRSLFCSSQCVRI